MSSGSSCLLSLVEPTTSTKRTVSCLSDRPASASSESRAPEEDCCGFTAAFPSVPRYISEAVVGRSLSGSEFSESERQCDAGRTEVQGGDRHHLPSAGAVDSGRSTTSSLRCSKKPSDWTECARC